MISTDYVSEMELKLCVIELIKINNAAVSYAVLLSV